MQTFIDNNKPVRSFFRRLFPGFAVFVKGMGLMYSRRSMLRTSGYIESVRIKRPVRPDGSRIAWFNYASIYFLERRLTNDLNVFEYGSGNSTHFFAERVRHVTSLESQKEWYDDVLDQMPENVELKLFDEGDDTSYWEVAHKAAERFDIILVDSLYRNECLESAPEALSERGVVILDDSDREEYAEGRKYLLENGFRELPFVGLKAGGIRAYGTSIFYRPGNCFGI